MSKRLRLRKEIKHENDQSFSYSKIAVTSVHNAHVQNFRPISFPESSFPLTSGLGYERLWVKAFPITGFLLFQLNCAGVNMWFKMASDSSFESACSSSFHKAIEFSLRKLGKPKLELKTEQYDAIRAICFERKDTLTVLPTGFGKSLIYQILPGILTMFKAAVSLNVIILLCLLCHP